MEVKNSTAYQTTFNGKFVLSKSLSKAEEEIVERFSKYVYGKKNNIQVLKPKSYDIFVQQNEKDSNLLELTSQYVNYWSKGKTDCFISFIHKSGDCLEGDTASFRASLKWFENYKYEHAGYNNLLEKIAVGIREFIFN